MDLNVIVFEWHMHDQHTHTQTHTRSRAWGECRCVGAWLKRGTCPLSMCQWQWQPGHHRTTGLPGNRQSSRPAHCSHLHNVPSCHVPSCTLYPLYSLSHLHGIPWTISSVTLIGISASVTVADFCASFGAQVSPDARPFVHLTDTIQRIVAAFQHVSSIRFISLRSWVFLASIFLCMRVSLWLINRRLNAADCVKGSWHVISDGLSGPTSYKRCRQLSQQFSFQIFWSTDVK